VFGGSGDLAGRWSEIGAGVGYAWRGGVVRGGAVPHFALAQDVDGRLRTLLTMSTVALLMLAAGVVAGNLALPQNPAGWLGSAC